MIKKKNIIISILLVVFIGVVAFLYKKRIVFDVSRLSPTLVSDVLMPHTVHELQTMILNVHQPISFSGGRFSQGGQIAYERGIMIDMTSLDQIIAFDQKEKTITVQPGIRWSEIQKYINPYGLSVKVMQSYNDFTVGGSLSVNVHGRDPLGSLIKTVKSIKIVMADGSIKFASPDVHEDLFNAAIGGYGLLGAIIEVTLQLTDDQKIERVIKIMPLSEYVDYFFKEIYQNKNVVFHNANIYPNEFEEVLAVTWYKTDKKLTIDEHIQKHGLYLQEKIEEQLLRRFSSFKKIRQQIEPQRLHKSEIVWRNYEMSHSVESLEPLVRWPSTSILQEYFVPLKELVSFIETFKGVVKKYKVNVLNVSIRYVAADTESILAYAPQEMFALVCYINVIRTFGQTKERAWTRELIDAVLLSGGTFYLPYHLYANQKQFRESYPGYKQFLDIKKQYDPTHKFMNALYKSYMAEQ